MAEKTLEEIKADILHRAGRINPFERVKKEDVEQVVRNLTSLDADLWGREWGKVGLKYERLARSKKNKDRKKTLAKLIIWRTSTTVSGAIRCQAARKK